jgi:hypothetical protein
MTSLKDFLCRKVSGATAEGADEEFTLICKQAVSDEDLERWLRDFSTQERLDIRNEYGNMCFSLQGDDGNYALVVTNSTEQLPKRIMVALTKLPVV